MSFSPERIYWLLQAYTGQTASEAEEQELFRWIEETADDTLLKEHIRQLIEAAHKETASTEPDWEKIYTLIQAEKENSSNDDKASLPVIRRIPRVRLLVAAISLLIIAGSIALFLRHKRPATPAVTHTEQHYQNDIPPGGTKAMLRAGGQQVVLNRQDTSFSLAGNTVQVAGGGVKTTDVRAVQYTLITPRGGEYHIQLADGTIVWLNAASRLEYPAVFTGAQREVKLEGEAYFEVQHDAAHPFVVHTLQQDIRVLGTSFNVHAYKDEPDIATTLVAGKVQVDASGTVLMLEPGQQAQIHKNGNLRLNPDPDIEQVLAWKNGYFRFEKADIRTIMQQLSKWYNVEVTYAQDLRPHYFGAIISRSSSISQILKVLEATDEVHFRVEGRTVTVMP